MVLWSVNESASECCDHLAARQGNIGTPRIERLDQWKGASIVAVIAIHASGTALTFPPSTFNWAFGLIVRQPINFAVPMFLALAGYLAGAKRLETPSDRRTFWRNRFERLLLPYLVWTLATVALRTPSHLISPIALAKDILLGQGIGVGYFVIVLAQFIAVTPLIASLKRSWHHIAIMGIATAAGLATRYYFQIEQPDSILAQFPLYALHPLAWYPFYHLGFWIHRTCPSWLNRQPAMTRLAGFFLLLSIAEGWLLASQGYVEFATSQLKTSSFLMSGSLVLIALSSDRRERGSSLLASLGRNSYFIYLSHGIFLAGWSSILSRSAMLYSAQPAFFVTLTVATSISTALANSLVQHVIPAEMATKWLGVARVYRASK